MRRLSRWLRRQRAELALRPRRQQIAWLLSSELNRSCHLSRAGARGRDSIYEVSDQQGCFACLRIVNPHLKRKPLAPDSPFCLPADSERLERERACYQRGADFGLTPKPVWHTTDALACEYISGERVMYELLRQPALFWSLMCEAAERVLSLHALGVIHMDVSLANLIRTPSNNLVFIDFEYAPVAGLNDAQQRAYDHLRLVESCIKFMPESAAPESALWLELLTDSLDQSTRSISLEPLSPALKRLLSHPHLGPTVARVFDGRETSTTG